MSPVVLAVVRRAILDLLDDIGGEQNDDVLAMLLAELGHRVARRDVAAQIRWLDGQGLVKAEDVQSFVTARIVADGRDVAAGRLRVDGVSRHKTGE